MNICHGRNENWVDIEGYEGFYQVSDTGIIQSVDRHVYHPRLAALAQTAYEEAAMWAVKLATA